MPKRDQLIIEAVEELPDNKRACTSSASGMSRDPNSPSCDPNSPSQSDEDDYSYEQSQDDQSQYEEILSTLGEEVGDCRKLACLSQLCQLLSLAHDDSLSSSTADSLSPVLVKLTKHESNPDIVLLAWRAITYLCDIDPRSSSFLVKHDVVPSLCQRLMEIEYLDVAEQCLQALGKISLEEPLPCLQSGAIVSVLRYVDFFSTSVQRVALSTVVNICEQLPSGHPMFFMEAVPSLCSLLQCEDTQLVESVVSCCINIVRRVSHSKDMLDQLCGYGLVQNFVHLIGLKNQTTLSRPTYLGLIRSLSMMASGSTVACKTLSEMNISGILKDMLSNNDLSRGMQSTSMADGYPSQVRTVLKLLNELLLTLTREQNAQLTSDEEAFHLDRAEILQKFQIDLLPILTEVVSSSMHATLCYQCLSVIKKLVSFPKSDTVLNVLQTAKFPSFLAGVLTRDDQHVISLALEIVDAVMLERPHDFLNSFIKEGGLYAIGALLSPDKCSQWANDGSREQDSRDFYVCPCVAFDESQSSRSRGTCQLQRETIQKFAKHIQTKHFAKESLSSKGVTDVLQKLTTLASDLTALVDGPLDDGDSTKQDDFIHHVLHQVVSELNGENPISTFELVKSGIIRALANCLSNGQHLREKVDDYYRLLHIVEERFEIFAQLLFSFGGPSSVESPLLQLVRKLQSALSFVENFPVISTRTLTSHEDSTSYPELNVGYVKAEGEISLHDYTGDGTADPFCPIYEIERVLWPSVRTSKTGNVDSSSSCWADKESSSSHSPSASIHSQGKSLNLMASNKMEEDGNEIITDQQGCHEDEDGSPELCLYFDRQHLNSELTLYQSILKHQTKAPRDNTINTNISWTRTYTVTYRRAVKNKLRVDSIPFLPGMFSSGDDQERSNPVYDILFLLQNLEKINKCRFEYISSPMESACNVPQNEFVSSKLTEKLERQMRDLIFASVGAMPSWCTQLMTYCPFLFRFEARFAYFNLSAFGQSPVKTDKSSHGNGRGSSIQQQNSPERVKFMVNRDNILDSAAKMMDLYANEDVVLEVEYNDEVGTGLGPTLEFYTSVCHEFQRSGLGMWRDDHFSLDCEKSLAAENAAILASPFGLFPRPRLPSSGIELSEVHKKFHLLGQIVAQALHDRRVLDLPFSKAFLKLILGQNLTVHDIQSFDPQFGRVLLEFRALVKRKMHLESIGNANPHDLDICFRDTRIEDLYLDFTLPGYPDCPLIHTSDKMVNLSNLEEYVTLVVDTTIHSGISGQVEAFKSGFNKVFSITSLNVFTKEELEHLLCGEQASWNSKELFDNIQVDHGYTVRSHHVVDLLKIVQEFDREQQRAFLQFVTGAPRLPPGGFSSLNPKFTIVRKHCGGKVDAELPSVMTCANYLKLPPYSSKAIMKQKLLYAITEGQGSFHLS